MSSRVTGFNEIINNELENRFKVFCQGNSGCNSFCSISNKINNILSNICELDMANDNSECTVLEKHCQNCIIREFLNFNNKCY